MDSLAEDSEEEKIPDNKHGKFHLSSVDKAPKKQEKKKIDAEWEAPTENVELTKLLKIFPESLESFSFVCQKYNQNVNVNDYFELDRFLKGIVLLGVKHISLSNVNFDNKENVEMVKDAFRANLDYDQVSYLSFNKCPGIVNVDQALADMRGLENIIMQEWGINGKLWSSFYRR